ncbi:hypothetical protein ACO1O0_005035 [Amphichorda felina]
MNFLRSLCCGSSPEPTPAEPTPAEPAPRPAVTQDPVRETAKEKVTDTSKEKVTDTAKEKVNVLEVPKLSSPPSHFITHISRNPNTPTTKLLKPYLEYELWLRKAFARGDTELDGLANLIPVYGQQDEALRIRNIDRQVNNRDKYLMRLPDGYVEPDGAAAIAASLEDYKRNFGAFTHYWSNIVAAGSSALLPLLSHDLDIENYSDPSVQDPLEKYYQRTAGTSDIDIFIYGLDEDAAIRKITQIEAVVRKNQRLTHGIGLALRTEHAITFVSPKWPYRHVQIILRLYKSISEVLTGFDVDCACVAFDGEQVYTNPRAVAAIATRTNLIDLSRRSPSYENRLYKYRSHDFDAYWDSLDRSKVDPSRSMRGKQSPELKGLARIIFFEYVLKKWGNQYLRQRLLKTIDENGEPTNSGYATLEVPSGERFTASKVRKFVSLHSKEPYVFGTIDQVLTEGAKSTKKKGGKLGGRVAFLKDDPGRQMIGSFHPLTEDDW